MKFSIGSDQEHVVRDANGNLKSAIGIVNGSKEAKLDLGDGVSVFFDNVMAECNIKPAYSKKEFIENIRICTQKYAKNIRPNVLCIESSATYPDAELEHDEAWKFACTPDFCAYDLIQREPPVCDPNTIGGFRSAGGHIHLSGEGHPFNTDMGKINVIRMVDLLIGVPSMLIDNSESSISRRRLYGAAGSHRPVEAHGGVEYRSLSNFWLKSPELAEWIYDCCDLAIDLAVDQYEKVEELYSFEDVKSAINDNNQAKIKSLMKVIKKLMPEKLFNKIDYFAKKQYNSFYQEWNIE